jgi:hypothetical protein
MKHAALCPRTQAHKPDSSAKINGRCAHEETVQMDEVAVWERHNVVREDRQQHINCARVCNSISSSSHHQFTSKAVGRRPQYARCARQRVPAPAVCARGVQGKGEEHSGLVGAVVCCAHHRDTQWASWRLSLLCTSRSTRGEQVGSTTCAHLRRPGFVRRKQPPPA